MTGLDPQIDSLNILKHGNNESFKLPLASSITKAQSRILKAKPEVSRIA